MRYRTLELIAVTTALLFISIVGANDKQDCENGWFGKRCQYLCHCSDNQCDGDGLCTGSATCVPGWFGPSCQYVDLAYLDSRSKAEDFALRDGDHGTCLEGNPFSIELTLTNMFHLSWFRLVLKEPAANLPPTFTLLFREEDDEDDERFNSLCWNQRTWIVSETVVDVYCDLPNVSAVIFEGPRVGLLCTVHVSGGRNVALKENVDQSSTKDHHSAGKAVDGHVRPKAQESTCAVTDDGVNSGDPDWTLAFSQPHLITRVVIHYQPGCCPGLTQMPNYVIMAHDEAGTDITFSVSKVNTANRLVLIPSTSTFAIDYIRIFAANGQILLLCEVEVFGESACPRGKFGRDCEHTCNCADTQESCLVNTGVCFTGCALGYYGNNCSVVCPHTYFGEHCKDKCSRRCLNHLCHHETGFCLNCPPDTTGRFCRQGCPFGSYGHQCRQICGVNCGGNGGCTSPSGKCTYGCRQGYFGPTCSHWHRMEKRKNTEDLPLPVFILLYMMLIIIAMPMLAVAWFFCKRKWFPNGCRGSVAQASIHDYPKDLHSSSGRGGSLEGAVSNNLHTDVDHRLHTRSHPRAPIETRAVAQAPLQINEDTNHRPLAVHAMSETPA